MRVIAASTAATAIPSVDVVAASFSSDPVAYSNVWYQSCPLTSATESDERDHAAQRDEQEGEHTAADTDDASSVLEAPSATEELTTLARRFNLTHGAVNAFPPSLQRLGHDVPKDTLTILGTERRAKLDQTNTFVHFGLSKGLEQALDNAPLPQEVHLQTNIDGLPLFKSASVGFWSIICRVTNCGDSTHFIVSLFWDSGKPPKLVNFLEPFLKKVKELTSSGMVF